MKYVHTWVDLHWHCANCVSSFIVVSKVFLKPNNRDRMIMHCEDPSVVQLKRSKKV